MSKNGTSWRKSSEEMTEAHLLKPLETELAELERRRNEANQGSFLEDVLNQIDKRLRALDREQRFSER